MRYDLTRWFVVDKNGRPTTVCPFKYEANAEGNARRHNTHDVLGWADNRPYRVVKLVAAIRPASGEQRAEVTEEAIAWVRQLITDEGDLSPHGEALRDSIFAALRARPEGEEK